MNFLRELSMGEITSRLAAVLIFAALQGVLIAGLARMFGDRRPAHDGRLTINPFNHVSVWGALIAALFGMSWIRSIWFDVGANRLGRLGAGLVPVLGLAAMLAILPLSDLLRPLFLMLPRTGGYATLYVLDQFQKLTLASVMLNVLPLPGLVAGGVWQAIWPGEERRLWRLEPFCLALVIVAIVAGWLPNLATLVPAFR